MEKNKFNNISLIVMVCMIVIAISGGTYAYWVWNSENTLVTFSTPEDVDFTCSADGGEPLTSSGIELIPAPCTNSNYALKREINVTTENERIIELNMYLDIVNITSALSSSSNFRYSLTTSDSSCDSSVIVSGNFYGKNIGDQITLLDQITIEESSSETYYLYIWLDEAETDIATANQQFHFQLAGQCQNK